MNKVTLFIKKHESDICMWGSIALSVGATIYSIVATTKVVKDVEDMKTELKSIEEDDENKNNINEKTKVYGKYSLKIGVKYAPALVLETASIVLNAHGYNVLKARNAALVATVGALSTKIGYLEEKLEENGCTEENIRNIEDGEFSKTKDKKIGTDFSFIFSKETSPYFESDENYVESFISGRISEINDILLNRHRGLYALTVNDIYDRFLVKRIKEGMVFGYTYPDHPIDDGERLIPIVIDKISNPGEPLAYRITLINAINLYD